METHAMTMPDWHMPWMLLIALQPLAIILLRKLFVQNNLNQYAQVHLQPWVRLQHSTHHINYSLLRNTGYCLAWLLFAIAAAGPRVATDTPNLLSQHGKDIMVVLDISQSMQATDIKPSRLRQAHKKISLLINAFPDSRIGIIVYAAKPHLYVPLTHDKAALQFYLRNLDFLTPPSQGTRPSLAIMLANKQFVIAQFTRTQRGRYILHLTDADTDEKENISLENISSLLVEKQTALYTLLMASDKGDAIPAVKDGWLSIDGLPVISRPDISIHQQFSVKTGGGFARSYSNHSGVNTLIEKIQKNQSLFKTNEMRQETNWNELFPVFLLIGILFLMLSMSPYKLTVSISTKVSSWFVIFILLGAFASTDVSAKQPDITRDAYQALINEDFLKARQLYALLHNFPGQYGEAVASYRMDDYPRAIRLFEQSVLLAESNNDYTNTLYNLGNSYFQTGNFQSALISYQGALLYSPTHQASQRNIIYVKRVLLVVAERKKNLAITTRAGRGPRSARAADNIILNENNGVSLDDSEFSNNDIQNTHADSALDIPEFIILKGLSFAEKSVRNKRATDDNNERIFSTLAINNQLNKLHDNQALLWQRIFELEEGYPAPLDEPEQIPGILPW